MSLTKIVGLVTVALGIVVLFSADAAAQAPVLSVTASGATVTIQYTSVFGAQGYTLQVGTVAGGTDIATVNLHATVTRIVVNAPAGTYFLRVRAIVGNVGGPFSNEATVTVGGESPPPGCNPPVAPTVTVNVRGATVTLTWSGVAGAIGYQVQWSRFSGRTEFVENVIAPSASRYVAMVGTFYARVVAVTACGRATSAEVAFTIAEVSRGPLPRSPNPPPNQQLPVPTYGESVARAVAARIGFNDFNSCPERGPQGWLYMDTLVDALRTIDSRWGYNGKRGNANNPSHDVLNYNYSAEPDEGTRQVYAFDVTGSMCEGGRPQFQNITDPNGAGAVWISRGRFPGGFGVTTSKD